MLGTIPDGRALFPLGRRVLGFPELTALLSRTVIVLEFFGPCFAFVPFFTLWLRLAVISALVGFHPGIAACTDIGLFPYVSMVSWLVFVPGLVWGRPGPTLRASRPARVAAAFFVVYIVLWNLRGVWRPPRPMCARFSPANRKSETPPVCGRQTGS